MRSQIAWNDSWKMRQLDRLRNTCKQKERTFKTNNIHNVMHNKTHMPFLLQIVRVWIVSRLLKKQVFRRAHFKVREVIRITNNGQWMEKIDNNQIWRRQLVEISNSWIKTKLIVDHVETRSWFCHSRRQTSQSRVSRHFQLSKQTSTASTCLFAFFVLWTFCFTLFFVDWSDLIDFYSLYWFFLYFSIVFVEIKTCFSWFTTCYTCLNNFWRAFDVSVCVQLYKFIQLLFTSFHPFICTINNIFVCF